MTTIAALITCFNRKDKTLRCIHEIKSSKTEENIQVDIYVVDGGSEDGTVEAIQTIFPEVKIEQHKGLFWAGGMRTAWSMACKNKIKYDFFWLINDDTTPFNDCLQNLLSSDEYAQKQYGKSGIYVGATRDVKSGKMTYGGEIEGKGHILPNGTYQEIELGNANIMLVSREVFLAIGSFCKDYTHGIADYDYTLRAVRAGYPVLLLPSFCGCCENDHPRTWSSQQVSLKERIKYLYSPKGLAYREYMLYVKRFYPQKVFFIRIKLWAKTLFPFFWEKFKK